MKIIDIIQEITKTFLIIYLFLLGWISPVLDYFVWHDGYMTIYHTGIYIIVWFWVIYLFKITENK